MHVPPDRALAGVPTRPAAGLRPLPRHLHPATQPPSAVARERAGDDHPAVAGGAGHAQRAPGGPEIPRRPARDPGGAAHLEPDAGATSTFIIPGIVNLLILRKKRRSLFDFIVCRCWCRCIRVLLNEA